MRNLTNAEREVGLTKILLREDTIKDLINLPKIKQRLSADNYTSQVVKTQERQFVDEIEAKIAIAKWVDDRFALLKHDDRGGFYIPITLPKWNDGSKTYTLFEAKLYVCRMVENYSEHWRNIGTDYDWVSASSDVFGKRLDWNPILFADILHNQDRMDDWCREMHASKRAMGVYGY